MNKDNIQIKTALISVSNKEGIVDFAKELSKLNINILSTGGTSKLLREANIEVRDVSDLTNFPEIMDGRVKTLHPKVHGGILGLRDKHKDVALKHNIEWIDLVVVNLYPFSETINKPNVKFEEAIENIDIGGPSMIRSAAKNIGYVGVVVDILDYKNILAEITSGLTYKTRLALSSKAFNHTFNYDQKIYSYLNSIQENVNFSENEILSADKFCDLRYGENSHQKASAYKLDTNKGLLSAIQYQGKPLSYNNINDSDAALSCVSQYIIPASVIVKHANPCGVALGDNICDAFKKSFNADSKSAFGGVVALNKECDENTANEIIKIFFEVLIAPSFTIDALKILSKKNNLRVLELPFYNLEKYNYKFINGGFLKQETDNFYLQEKNLTCVTDKKPSKDDIKNILFAWPILKILKSNAILITKNDQTIGIGVGQVSRIDAVEIALKKAVNNTAGSILASDAFFPFRDSIDLLSEKNISAIVQPGGSVKDQDVIDACNEHGIAMVFTGFRCFKH
ncbi:bifunctional phosphoribosylaminoimidazolecarboxamide formyltransferase/IMP cyclohydrolase [Gammaproteobacteria bacterium]|nr:bifunctional phosphoribosylaminoimidazolecarboxamide formyltransferase/IMP cyclohydrolase [Gammaproteobacteria bacterium]